MHRFASGLVACVLLSSVSACSEPTGVTPIAIAASNPLFASVGVGPVFSPTLLTFGGAGGSAYYDFCPAGAIAIGTSGTAVRYNGTAAIYNLRLRCATLNEDGSQVMIGGRGLGLGVDQYAPFNASCPDGSVIVGASGIADGLIRSYGVQCRSFEGSRETLGPWTGLGAMPIAAGAYSGECGPGQAIAGMISHAGYVLDGMSFLCREITGAAPTATFSAPVSVPEGSVISLSMIEADAAGDVSQLTFAFDCGSGYGAPGASSTAACPTTDDASVVVRGRVATIDGISSEYTGNVTVTNVAPSVAPLASASLLVGESYAFAGSFADPGADTWSGSVDYGSGVATGLTLSGMTFSLSNAYASSGTFTISVGIADDDGGVGGATGTVVVMTPAEGGAELTNEIGAMVTSGDVSPETAAPLLVSITAATKHLAEGRTIPAQNQLKAFKNKVEAAAKSGKITDAVATSLKKGADRLIASSSM